MGTESLDFEDSEKRDDGFFFSRGQLIFCLVITSGLIAGVGCMCFYLPDRSCEYPEPTQEATEPPRETTLAPTEAPWGGRLPRSVIPEVYHLTVQPYLYSDDLDGGKEIYTFDGEVTIELFCDQATNTITLHTNDIQIVSNELTDNDGNAITIESRSYKEEFHFQIFQLGSTLQVGERYLLNIVYIGQLNTYLVGFYRSSYTAPDGSTKYIATSQMQPTDARRALPCFDEPDLKAVFNTSIIYRNYMVALTNGIEETTVTVDSKWDRTWYKPTPKMSTYLLAFVVGELDYTEETTASEVRFRVWSRPEMVNKTTYPLIIGRDIHDYFEDYFNVPYPLEKQDNVGVPDFSAGAMENWGLIIYREAYVLYDPASNSASDKQRSAVVFSHELAHQWFGNLVTPIWWDDLWLNEGFASYVEYIGVNEVEPDWEMAEQFVVIDLQYVFNMDSLGTSHPIRVPVNSPAEISEIFDSISYSKGAAIIRMLNHFLGEEVFIDGLTNYLITFSEGNANSDDLWAALTAADVGKGDTDVKAVMDTWTLQMGYPVVDLRRTDRTTLNASQEHFLINPDAGVEDKYSDCGYLWWVFLTFTHKTDQNFMTPSSVWLQKDPWKIVSLSNTVQQGDWYLANIHQYGYYRVNYEDANWLKLGQQLLDDHLIIPNENRAQLIDDAFNLARVGRMLYPTALDLTEYLDGEQDYVPWEAALGVISYIADMMSRHYGYGPLERYMRVKIDPLYTHLGWDDQPTDPHLDQFNRVNAIGTACKYRNEDCLIQASELYAAYMRNVSNNVDGLPDQDINPITPNLKRTIYCYGVMMGDQEEWDFGWEQYQITTDSSEQSKWRYALSCAQAPWILSRYLDYSLDENLMRKQDSSYAIRYVAQNYVGRSIAWDFLRTNWDQIYDYYGASSFTFSNIIEDVTSDFNTDLELEELIEFGEGRDFGSAIRTYEQAIEKTQANVKWVKNYAESVASWLEEKAPAM